MISNLKSQSCRHKLLLAQHMLQYLERQIAFVKKSVEREQYTWENFYSKRTLKLISQIIKPKCTLA